MSDLVNQTLGKYKIVARLGRGGMADVYKAFNPNLQQHVAIKLLHGYPAEREIGRFEQEAAAVARLRHPNIVRIFDFDVDDSLHYMVMELIDGPTLEAKLKADTQKGQRDMGEIARIFGALANAIDYAHSRKMVHHDLKPANIMFTEDGDVVLMDFGIARIIGERSQHTATGSITGTPAYMSPEQCKGMRGDTRSDIYSLGVILYEMACGRPPFQAENVYGYIKAHIGDRPPLPSQFNPEVTPPVENVILKGLQKNPAARYQTAGEMAAELRAALGLSTEPSVARISTIEQSQIDWDAIESYISTRRRAAAPFQAPRDVGAFVGREALLTAVQNHLAAPDQPAIVALTGMGGIGKTALAVRLAHDLRDKFLDGVLWANLAASDPLAVLDSWARAFGFDFSSLPDLDSRAAALRGELASKQVLLVLDDVWQLDAVRPLLPGGAQNGVILTTRDQELPVALGATAVPVPVLAETESHSLLTRIAGEERVAAETAVAAEIGDLLGHLPLAVEIAARLLLSRRRWRLADLVARLRDADGRLAALRLQDRAVRASFVVSFEQLPEVQKGLFGWLGLFGGRPFTPEAYAAIAEIPASLAEDFLYHLATLSLAAEAGETHFRQHPLLADFAREQLGEEEWEKGNGRLARYYLIFASKHLEDYAALNQEQDNLLAGMRGAYDQEQWELVRDYADALSRYWFAQGHFTQARQGHGWAAAAAAALADDPARIIHLTRWGQACLEQGDYAEAQTHLQAALKQATEAGQKVAQAEVSYHLGRIAIEQNRLDEARQELEQAQAWFTEMADTRGIARTLYLLADVEYYRRNYLEAELLARQALSMQPEKEDGYGRIQTLRLLADIALHGQKDLAKANGFLERAINLSHDQHNEGELAVGLYANAEIYRQQGQLNEALTQAKQALTLLARMGDRKSQSQVLYRISLIRADNNEHSLALSAGLESLEICRQLDDKQGMIYVLAHLGEVSQNLGYAERALETWRKALSLAQEIQHPLVDWLQKQLDL